MCCWKVKVNMVISTHLQTSFGVHQFSHWDLLCSRVQSQTHESFNHHLSPDTSNLGQFLSLSLLLMTLIFLKGTSQMFCRCSRHMGLSDVCLLSGWDYERGGGGGNTSEASSCCLLWCHQHLTYHWLITDRLVKVVPAWFLHCNIGILPRPHSGGYYPLLKMKTPSSACDGMGRSAGLLRPRSGFGPGPWYPALLLELWTLTFQGGASIAVFLTCWLGDCLAFQFCTEFLLSFTPCPCLSKRHIPECQGRGSNDARWPWP